MSVEVIQVDDSRVTVSLGKFSLSLSQNGELMKDIGFAQLISIRKTFSEQGSPAGSWAPLAPSTIRSYGKEAIGHKLLVLHHFLERSIDVRSEPGIAIIGTSLKYAAVHQFGSRDRGSIGLGPRTEAQQKATIDVKEHTYSRVQNSLGKGKAPIVDRLGRRRIVNRAIAGPLNRLRVHVAGHARHQNIPARPYLVFRPEDPGRIQSLVNAYVERAKAAAGLGGAQ